jgi:hypothetical protein
MFKSRILVFLAITLLFLISSTYAVLYYFKHPAYGEMVHDLFHTNRPVRQYAEARKILSTYPTLNYSELPIHIKNRFSEKIHGSFYAIPENDLYKKICVENRINSFLSHEDRIIGYSFKNKRIKYVYINEQILRYYFKLTELLAMQGYNNSAIRINSAYRSHIHNKKVGGARESQHLKGKALDLKIGDINEDGKINSIDKQIVAHILEKEIIKNTGGIGFYPGTMVIHMDVRGHRARWDHYKR